MLDIFEGNGVVHALNGNMVVRPHGRNFPYRQLIWMRRQRAQKGQFFCKCAGSAAFALLEGLVIEALQAFPDCFIQLRQGQKLPVPQRGKDVCGNDPLIASLYTLSDTFFPFKKYSILP